MLKWSRSLLLPGILALGGLAGCGDDVTVAPPPTPAVTGISVSPPSLSLNKGEKGQLSAAVTTNDASVAKTVTWSTANAAVATVDNTGLVTAVGAGNTTVTAKSTVDQTFAASAQITVTDQGLGIIKVNVDPASMTLAPGEKKGIAANVDINPNKQPPPARTVTFTSSATTVATVDANGVVTGVTAGTAIIKVASTVDPLVFANVAVTVRQPVPAAVSIQKMTFGNLNTPVNIANVFSQMDVTINLEPNDETVTRLDLIVDNVIVASQVFSQAQIAAMIERSAFKAAGQVPAVGSAAAGASSEIVLSFHTDAFDPATGVASFLNGNHSMQAKATVTTPTTPTQRASNSVALVFNNNDGFYVTVTNTPTNTPGIVSAINPGPGAGAGVEWRQGNVNLHTVPVIYTPTTPNGTTAKSVCFRTVNWNGASQGNIGSATNCKGGVQDTTLTLAAYQTVAVTPQVTDLPRVVTAVFTDGSALTFNTNAAAPNTLNGVLNAPPNRYPAGPPAYPGLAAGVVTPGFNMDNVAPVGTALTLPIAPDNWTNGPFNWAATVGSGGATTRGVDGGVGSAAASTDVYEFDDRAVAGVTWVGFNPAPTANCATRIPENPIDFTNNAYNARLTQKDLLNNAITVFIGGGATPGLSFGVDCTAPEIQYTGGLAGLTGNATVMDPAKDSIMTDLVANTQGITSITGQYATRIRDSRSGFNITGNPGTQPLRRRLTLISPSASTIASQCATGVVGTTCAFQQVLPPIDVDDPTYRRDVIPVFGTNAGHVATTNGYYLYETFAADRAGNVSATVTKRGAIDAQSAATFTDAAPQITGLAIPAVLNGASTVSFVPTGLDELEVLQGQLHLRYPNVAQGGPINSSDTISFARTSTDYGAPWDAQFSTPVGPGATFGNVGLTMPIGFLRGIDVVDPVLLTPPAAVTATYKPTFVGAQLFDIKRMEATLGGASADSTSILFTALLPGLIQNGVPFPAIGVGQWFIFGTAGSTGGTIQARALTQTVITQPPFSQVAFFRLTVDGRWQFLDVVTANAPTNPTLFDQGQDRFWTYSSHTIAPSVANGDKLMAVGMSPAGDGLATFIVAGGIVPPPAP